MTQVTVDASQLGLGSIEVDHSFGMKRKAGELNKDISQIQLDAQRKFSAAVRDMNVLQKLNKYGFFTSSITTSHQRFDSQQSFRKDLNHPLFCISSGSCTTCMVRKSP